MSLILHQVIIALISKVVLNRSHILVFYLAPVQEFLMSLLLSLNIKLHHYFDVLTFDYAESFLCSFSCNSTMVRFAIYLL